jgi:hypothetical protein
MRFWNGVYDGAACRNQDSCGRFTGRALSFRVGGRSCLVDREHGFDVSTKLPMQIRHLTVKGELRREVKSSRRARTFRARSLEDKVAKQNADRVVRRKARNAQLRPKAPTAAEMRVFVRSFEA